MGSNDTKIKAKWQLNAFKLNVELNGGTISKDYSGNYEVGSTITIENPTKEGYTFDSWSVSGSDASINDNVLTMGTEDTTITAKWIANTNTAYVVKHWTQNLGASTTQNSTNYTVNSTENKTGTTASSVTPSVKTITGFTSPSTQTKTIAADGSMVIDYYYTRNSYTYTLGSKTGVTTTGSSTTGSYQYGATITLKASANAGYTWSKWTSSNTSLVSDKTTANTTFKMPAGNVTMTPNVTVNTYTISYTLNGGTKGSSAPTSGTYGSTVTVSNPTRSGYTFTGWSVSGTGASISGTTLTIGAGNITLTANWKVSNTIPAFTYTGTYEIVDDNDNKITTSTGNWKIRFLTSGTLKFTELRGAANGIDVFLVGGGASGFRRGGGGGGRTTTAKGVSVTVGSYEIVVGAGGAGGSSSSGSAGGKTTAFSKSASGGSAPDSDGYPAGSGGSGGGGRSDGGGNGGAGGSNGGSGEKTGGGSGQGTTTREFGESSGKLYAGGGGGGGSGSGSGGAGGAGGGGAGVRSNGSVGGSGQANTGGGGGGSDDSAVASKGGSGIVIIRNKR